MEFDITHENRTTLAVDYQGALDLGYPAAVAGAALKGAASAAIAATADGYRAKLAGAGAIKVAGEYHVKAQIAAAPEAAAPADLAILDREAAARGVTRDVLLAEIGAKAAAFRQIALLVGAIEAEAKAKVKAFDPAAEDIEAQVQTALEAARAEAEASLAQALALLGA